MCVWRSSETKDQESVSGLLNRTWKLEDNGATRKVIYDSILLEDVLQQNREETKKKEGM